MACICEKIQVKTDNQGRIASCSDFNIGAGYQSILRTRNLGKEAISNCYLHSNSLSNKMNNSLLAVRDIDHKYIVVERMCSLTMEYIKKIGLIVNPVAGLGGKAGLKGSDGEEIQAEALKKGVRPEANMKAERALEQLLPLRDGLEIVTYEGVMGGNTAKSMDFNVSLVGREASPGHATAEDTERLAAIIAGKKVDLILLRGAMELQEICIMQLVINCRSLEYLQG